MSAGWYRRYPGISSISGSVPWVPISIDCRYPGCSGVLIISAGDALVTLQHSEVLADSTPGTGGTWKNVLSNMVGEHPRYSEVLRTFYSQYLANPALLSISGGGGGGYPEYTGLVCSSESCYPVYTELIQLSMGTSTGSAVPDRSTIR